MNFSHLSEICLLYVEKIYDDKEKLKIKKNEKNSCIDFFILHFRYKYV